MDRYNKSNGVDVAPAAPAVADHPFYTAGDPENDVPATVPGPWLFHMLIESMRNVIVAAGLTPSHTDLNLLRDAIKVLIAGGDYKASCRVASTAALNTAAPGANIDGVAMIAGDRVLLKDQAAPAQNGIWIWNGAAVAMARAVDSDSGAELNSGAIVPIEQGTVNADTNWQLITDGVIVIGTTELVFQKTGGQNFASAAEAQAFVSLTKTLSPGTLHAALQGSNQTLSASGYQKLPGGLILQWGLSASITSDNGTTVTFPVAFPNACFLGLATPRNDAASGSFSDSTSAHTGSYTLTTMRVILDSYSAAVSRAVSWFAIGW